MIKRQILKFANSLLMPLGAQLVKASSATGIANQQFLDPSTTYMKDKNLRRTLISELSDIAQIYLSERLSSISLNNIDYTSEVENFMTIYSNRPKIENQGGSGFHNAFWLFLFARAFSPSLIVESGVWKGHTTWLLEQACPNARIFGFDINLSRLEYKSLKARFYEHDWSEFQFEGMDSESSLVFFDCHVNHAKRICESHDRGFRHLIFDDNPPAHILYGHALPGFPTANMLWRGLEMDNSKIEWYWKGKDISYEVKKDEFESAKKIVEMHEVFPDVGDFSKYGGFSYLTYVNIKSC